MKTYEENIKAWYLLTISLSDITYGLASQYNENEHKSWVALIENYEVS